MLAIVLMGAGSLMMALLPPYSAAGITAPVLLVLARLVQGLSAGGEYGSAMTYVYESFDGRRRGLAVSFLTVALFSGTAAAAGVVGLVSALTTDAEMEAWGWRIPFLLGVPLALICLWMRRDLDETSTFHATLSGTSNRGTVRNLLRTHSAQLLQVVLISTSISGASYMVLTYFVIHLQQVGHFDRTSVTWITAGVILAVAVVAPLVGVAVDRFGPVRTSIAGLLVYAVLAYPTLIYMSGHGLAVASLFFLLFAMGTPLVQVSKDRLFPALFGPAIRTTGVALGFNVGVVISGGTAAAICTWLVQSTGNHISPAYFVLLASAIGFLGVLWARRSSSSGMDTAPADRASDESCARNA